MDAAIFQLLAKGAGGFGRTRGLKFDHFEEVRDTGEVVFVVRLGGEVLNMYGDGRVWFLLFGVTVAC